MKGISLQISKETENKEDIKIIEILEKEGWSVDNIEFF